MRYLEVTVRCGREAAPAVEAVLSELGGGVAIDDPLDVAQAQASGRWDYSDLQPGDTSRVTLRVYLPETGGLEQRRRQLDEALGRVRAQGLDEVAAPALAWVQEEDWAEAWKAFFKPLHFGRLVVAPTWETYTAQPGELVLRLDPGMAFGTGGHATTGLCLAWLEELVTPGATVVDVGTGSGILALAAKRLGAGPVLACDTDPVSVQVAAANALVNRVALTVVQGALEAEECKEWLAEQHPTLVVANIIADVIIPLCPTVAEVLRREGRFLASGIIGHRRDDVLAALADAGLVVEAVREEGGWVAVGLWGAGGGGVGGGGGVLARKR